MRPRLLERMRNVRKDRNRLRFDFAAVGIAIYNPNYDNNL